MNKNEILNRLHRIRHEVAAKHSAFDDVNQIMKLLKDDFILVPKKNIENFIQHHVKPDTNPNYVEHRLAYHVQTSAILPKLVDSKDMIKQQLLDKLYEYLERNDGL